MLHEEEKKTVLAYLSPYLGNEDVLKMKDFIQHGTVSTYDHALSVAFTAYEMAKKYRGVNMEELMAAAFLHDFYLYDWHEPDKSHKWHGFHHAKRAADNAKRVFGVSDAVYQAIYGHMWPLNPERPPLSKIAWILFLADKRVSLKETIDGKKRKVAEEIEKLEENELVTQ